MGDCPTAGLDLMLYGRGTACGNRARLVLLIGKRREPGEGKRYDMHESGSVNLHFPHYDGRIVEGGNNDREETC